MRKISLCFLLISLIILNVESSHKKDGEVPLKPDHDHRHDHGPPRIGFNHCCEVQETEADKIKISKQREIMDECLLELFDKDKRPPKHGLICILECVAKKANFFTEGNGLDSSAFHDYVSQLVENNDRFKAILDETVIKCIEKAKDSSTDRPNPDGIKCSQQPIKAMMCVERQFLKSCSAELQDPSEKCIRFREMLEKEPPTGDCSEEK